MKSNLEVPADHVKLVKTFSYRVQYILISSISQSDNSQIDYHYPVGVIPTFPRIGEIFETEIAYTVYRVQHSIYEEPESYRHNVIITARFESK